MSKNMEQFFAIRDAFVADKELLRLASLVGTDAKSPEKNLANYIAGMVMYHRESVRSEYESDKNEWDDILPNFQEKNHDL